ncbi:MAG: hypothetical protein J6T74_01245 [Clostridia bacterium]|nr:hypothetical protein [Clostridia bacterium]
MIKKIIAAKDFNANGVIYLAGDELKGLSFEQIVKLNEKGFIEPLDLRDIILITRENDKEKNIKEEKKYGSTL